MADEIKLKAPTVEQQVVVNINGEEKLRSFADTLEKISNNKNLQKYWKTQQELINATADAYGNFSKKASQDNAKELVKVTNALKAMAGTDLSNILPDFDKISKAMAEAQKVAGNIDSAFSVKGFKEAFDSFETLKAYGVDIQNLFSHFGVSSDVGELQKNVRSLEGEVEKLTRRLTNAKNANEELRNEFDNFKSGSGFTDKLDELDNLKSEMSYLREQAEETFRQFLKLNNITEDGYDRDGFYDDNRFKEYFQNIQSGYMSASDAIRQFKTEYSYLLEDSFKSNNDTFGLEQLQAFSNKLDSIFRQVEETSTKINDIISNGVITKSVENLSLDSSLSDSQRSLFGNLLKDEESLKSITALFHKLIEESNKTSKVDLFNDEQLQQVLSIFDKMEGHLSSLRSIISDVGDGGEFSPLLSTIDKINTSIKELSTSVKGIGLNMNIDVGSDDELDRKLQTKVANALQAYQKLFNNIKMSSAGGSFINQEFFDFNLDNYDTAYQKLKAIVNFIKKQRAEAKKQFNGYDALYEDSDKSLWKSAQAYLAQVTKAETEIKKANSGESNPLENLFGNTKDLSEVIEQLNKVVEKLNEISSSATEFKNIFKEGFNVTTSVEEIDKLTNRVKELEDELSKIKLNPVNVDKSNISSGNETSNLQAQEKIYLKMASNADLVGKSHAEIKQLLMEEDKNGDTINKDLRDRILLLENGRVISEANAEIYKDAYQTESLLGKTQQEVLSILQKENAEIEAGNRLFRERIIYFKDGVVAQEILGDSMRVNGNYNKSVEADEFLHTHPIGKLNQLFSIEDMYGFYDEFSKGLKQFSVLSGNKLSKFNLSGLNFDSYDNFVNQYILLMQSVESQFKNFADKGAVPSDKFETVVNNFQRVISKYITDTFGNLGAEFRTFKVDGMGNISDSMPSPLTNKLRDTIFEVSKFLESVYDKIHQGELSVEEAEKQLDAFTAKKFQKTYSQDNKISSSTPIEDVFQGDKIDQATTSAKELDKTLEQVDIPTDSFDKILSKLDLAKSELGEIVKITKQSVSDSEGKFHDSYTLKDRFGSTEIYGLSSNTEKGQLLRSNIVGYDAKEIEKETKAQQKVAEQEAKALNQAWEEANKVNNALNETKNTLSSLPRMTELDTQFTSLDAKLSNLNSELTSGKISVADYKKEVKSLTSEYSKLVTIQQNRDIETYKQNAKAAEQEAKAVKRLNDELEGYNNQIPKKPIDGQRSDYFEDFVQNYKNAIAEAQKYLDTLGDNPITKEVKDEWERLIGVIKKAKEEMDAVPNAARGSDEASRMKEIDKLTKYLDKNTRISKEAREQLEGYLALLKSGDPSVNVKEIHTAWTAVAVAEREAGREGKSFFDILKNKTIYGYAAQLAQYYLSFMDIIRYARNAVNAIRELDTALVDLKKTTTMSASDLERFYYNSNELAKKMGVTTAEIINQASAWSRLGFSTKEASTQMAELSSQFASISPGMDLDSATDGLVSSMKAFGIKVENVERDIMDNINRIGNTAATSNDEIVDMLTRSSAAMSAANNTIQETIALETAAVEITRNAETTGTAFKTKFCLYVQKCAYRKYLIAGNA